jgi:hypothetical protein
LCPGSPTRALLVENATSAVSCCVWSTYDAPTPIATAQTTAAIKAFMMVPPEGDNLHKVVEVVRKAREAIDMLVCFQRIIDSLLKLDPLPICATL